MIEQVNRVDAEFTGAPVDNDRVVENPIDGWIRLALYIDNDEIGALRDAVSSAIDRMKWEIKNMPLRWVHVRKQREADLTYWIALRNKLNSLYYATDSVPF